MANVTRKNLTNGSIKVTLNIKADGNVLIRAQGGYEFAETGEAGIAQRKTTITLAQLQTIAGGLVSRVKTELNSACADLHTGGHTVTEEPD